MSGRQMPVGDKLNGADVVKAFLDIVNEAEKKEGSATFTINVKGTEDIEKATSAIEKFQKINKQGKANYFTTEAKGLQKVIDAYNEYNKASKKGQKDLLGKELVKWTNAYKAMDNFDQSKLPAHISDLSGQLEKGFKGASGRGFRNFSVDSFKEIFSVMKEMESYGVDLSKVIGQIEKVPEAISKTEIEKPVITEDDIINSDAIQNRISELESYLEKSLSRFEDEITGEILRKSDAKEYVKNFKELDKLLDMTGSDKLIDDKYYDFYERIVGNEEREIAPEFTLNLEQIDKAADSSIKQLRANIEQQLSDAALSAQTSLENLGQTTDFSGVVESQDHLQTEMRETATEAEKTTEVLSQVSNVDLSGNTIRIFDGIKEQIYDVEKDADALYQKLDEMAEKMSKPVFHVGNLEKDNLSSRSYKPADSLKFVTERNRGDSLGTGTFWAQNGSDIITSLEALGPGKSLYAGDLSKYADNLLQFESDDALENFAAMLKKITSFVMNTIQTDEKYAKDLQGISSVDDLFNYYQEFFDKFGITAERLQQFIDSEVQRVGKYKTTKGMFKADSIGTKFQKDLLGTNGIDITRGSMDDSYAMGNVIFDIDNEHPFDIAFGQNTDVATYFYQKVLEKILKKKAKNPENYIEDLVDEYTRDIPGIDKDKLMENLERMQWRKKGYDFDKINAGIIRKARGGDVAETNEESQYNSDAYVDDLRNESAAAEEATEKYEALKDARREAQEQNYNDQQAAEFDDELDLDYEVAMMEEMAEKAERASEEVEYLNQQFEQTPTTTLPSQVESITEAEQTAGQAGQQVGQEITEGQEQAQNSIQNTTKLLTDLSELMHNLSLNNIRKFNESHDNFFGLDGLDENAINQKFKEIIDIQTIIKKLTRRRQDLGDNELSSMGIMSDDGTEAGIMKPILNKMPILRKLGYTTGAIRQTGFGYSADIYPIDDKAIQSEEEMLRILFDLHEKTAEAAEHHARSAQKANEAEQPQNYQPDITGAEQQAQADQRQAQAAREAAAAENERREATQAANDASAKADVVKPSIGVENEKQPVSKGGNTTFDGIDLKSKNLDLQRYLTNLGKYYDIKDQLNKKEAYGEDTTRSFQSLSEEQNLLRQIEEFEERINQKRQQGFAVSQQEEDALQRRREYTKQLEENNRKYQDDYAKQQADAFDKQVEQTKEKITSLQEKIQGLSEGNKFLGAGFDDQLEQLQDKFKELSEIDLVNPDNIKRANELYSEISKSVKEIESNQDYIKARDTSRSGLAAKSAKWLDNNTAAPDEMRASVKALYDELMGGDVTVTRLQEIKTSLAEVDAQAHAAGQSGLSFADTLRGSFRNLSRYLMSFASFYRVIGTIKQAINIVKELDTGLMEVKKVSTETESTLNKWQKTTFDQADNVGGTASQIQKSTASWLRLGKSFTEAQEAAQASVKLLNVSEFTNIDDATTSLVSMRQAFEDLTYEDFIDKLNGVGDNFSSSTDQLAQGMQNVSSVLKVAGNDIDQSLALLTAANDVTQDMSKASMGVRTVALRISGTQDAKEQLEELGEDTSDFIVQTQSKVDEKVRRYTATASNPNGISVLDESGRLRSTYDILLDISKIYDEIVAKDNEYGTNTSNALLELLAGKTRSNILASILQNPDVLQNAYEQSKNSQGIGDRELAIYLDSISAKIQQLQNRLQELASVTIESQGLKDLISLLTMAVEAATGLSKAFGGINIAAGALFTFFAKFKKNGSSLLDYDKKNGFSGKLVDWFGDKKENKPIELKDKPPAEMKPKVNIKPQVETDSEDAEEQAQKDGQKTGEKTQEQFAQKANEAAKQTAADNPVKPGATLFDHDARDAIDDAEKVGKDNGQDAGKAYAEEAKKQAEKTAEEASKNKPTPPAVLFDHDADDATQEAKEVAEELGEGIKQATEGAKAQAEAEPTSVSPTINVDGENVNTDQLDAKLQQVTEEAKAQAQASADATPNFGGEGSDASRRGSLGYKFGGARELGGQVLGKAGDMAGKFVNAGEDDLKQQLTQQKAAAEETAKANEQAAEAAQQKATEEAAATTNAQEGTAAMQEQAAAQEQVAAGAEQTNAALQDTPDPIQGAASGAKDLGNNLHDGANAAKELGNNASGISKVFSGLGNSIKNIAGQFVSMAANMLIATAASMAVSAVIKGLQYVAHYDENIIKKGKEAEATIRNINDAYAETESKTKSLGERYNELRKGVTFSADGSEVANVKLSEDEYEEFLSINNQLADLYPELVSGQDAQGNSLVDLGDNAQTATDKLNELLNVQKEIASYNIADNMQDAINGVVKSNKQIQGEIDAMQAERDAIQEQMDQYSFVEDRPWWLDEDQTIYEIEFDWSDKKTKDKLHNAMEQVQKETGATLLDMGYDEIWYDPEKQINAYKLQVEGTQEQAKAAVEELSKLIYGSLGEMDDAADEIGTKIEVSAKQMADNWETLTPSLTSSIKVGKTYRELIGDSKEFEEAFSEMLNNADYYGIFKRATKDQKANFVPYLRDMFVYSFDEALELAQARGERDKMDGYITDLFTLDTSKMDTPEMRSQVGGLLNKIFPNDYELQKNIRVALGYTYIDAESGKEIWNRDDLNTQINDNLKLRGYTGNINIANALTNEEATILLEGINNGEFKTPTGLPSDITDAALFSAYISAAKQYVEEKQKVKNEIKKTGTLGDILGNEEFKTKAEGYESNLSSLTSALQTLRDEGSLTAETMKDLQNKWPDMTDFSEKGIQKYATDELKQYINEFKEGWTDFSPEGVKQLDTYLQNLITMYKDVEVSAEDARQSIIDSLMASTPGEGYGKEDVMFAVYQRGIERLKQTYGENLNWNIVLALKDQFSGDLDELVERYGEYKMHWTIYVTYPEELENLAKHLEDIQSEQSEIEDGITYRENRGLKKTVKQYDKLLDNSKEQVKTIRSQNKYLKAQQSYLRDSNGILDKTSDAYRNIQKEIDSNNATLRSLAESQREYQMNAGTIATQNILDTIQTLQTAMGEGGLGAETLYNLIKDMPSAADALFHTSSGQYVDTQKMQQLVQEQGDYALALIDTRQASEALNYRENDAELTRLSKVTGIAKGDIDALNDALAEHPNNPNYAEMLDLTEANQNIQDTILNLQSLEEELRKSQSDLGRYQLAQSTANPSDNMQTIRGGMEAAKKLWDQGWIGKDDFTTFADLIATNAERGTQDAVLNFEKNYKDVQKYLTENADGVHRWVDDIRKLAPEYIKLNKAGEEFLDIDSMEKFSTQMGRSKEFAESMLMAMKDAGYEINLKVIGDEFANSFKDIDYMANNAGQQVSNLIDEMDELAKSGIDVSGGAEEAANALKQLHDSGFDVTDILEHLNKIGAKNGFKVNDDFSVDFIHPIEENIDEAVNEINNKEVKLSPKYKIEDSDVEDATQKLKEAFRNNIEQGVEESGITKYKLSDLLAIDHDDGAWSAGEKELEDLATSIGLTVDQSNALLAALVQLGLIEVDTDVETEGVEEAKTEVEQLKSEAEEPITITTQHLEESSNQARTEKHQQELQDRVQHIKQVVTTEVAQGSITPEEIKQMDDSEISMHFGVTGTEEIQQVKDMADQLSNQETDYTVKIDQTQVNGILDAIKETHEAPVNVEMNTDAWDTFKAEVEAGLDVTITPNTPTTPAPQSQPAMQSSSTSTINVDGSNAVKQIGAFNTMMSDLSNGTATIDVDISSAQQNIKTVNDDISALQSSIDGIGNKDIGINIDGQMAVTQLNALNDMITDIPDVQSTANIDVQTAVAQLNALEKQINDIPDGDTTVKANISDATNKLSLVRSMIVALNSMPVTISVTVRDAASSILSNIRSAINSIPRNVESTITTYRKTVVESEHKATGTAHVSHYRGTAYAKGTGYDMWEDYRHSKHAWAKGTPEDWELPRDEEALVNEVGTESIVRDGKWFEIPGGAHVESLKRGDIIFSAKQTEELKKYGKVYSGGGHGKIAYANGTAYNMINAYSRDTSASGGLNNAIVNQSKQNTGYQPASDSTVRDNTSAVRDQTKTTGKNTKGQKETKTKLDEFKEWLEKFVDWIEVRLDRLSSSIDNLSQKAENLVGFAKKNAEIDKALKLTGNSKGNEEYKLTITTDEDGVQRVSGIKGENIVKGTQIGDNIRGAQKYFDFAEQIRSEAINKKLVSKDQAADIIGKIQSGAIDIKSYDKEETREFISQYQEWYDKAMECVYAVDELKASQKDLAQQELDNVLDDYSALESISNAITGRAESMMKYYTSAGKAVNSKEAKKQLGNQVSEAQYMSGKYKQELDDYAKTLAHVLPYLKEGSVEYNEALAQYEELNQKYIDSVTLINDLNKQIADLDITKLGYVIDRFKNAGEKIAALVSLKNTRGTIYGDKSSRITESDYSRQASLNNDVIKLLNDRMNKNIVEAAKYDIDSENYKEYYDAIVADEQEIIKLIESNEELKKSIRDLRWKPFNDLQDTINNTIEDLDHLRGLMKDAQFFDEDEGTEITARGYANIALIAQQMAKTKKQIADYREALNKLQKEYKNGNISLETYNETSREYVKTIQSGVTQVEGYKDALVDMYKTQITNENKALQDVISKRKDALAAKKAYYDYDKKLKSENKDINNLKAQINALQGVEFAPSI